MRTKKIDVIRISILVVVVGSLLVAQFFGIFWHNAIWTSHFKNRGIDVSHYQGEIDWAKVRATKRFSFAYIKATEGHDYYDDRFAINWERARATGLKVGAYHFFSIRSPGLKQAEYFISIVPKELDALPPVLDVEIDTNQDQEAIRHELGDTLQKLEEHYGKRPIIYATYETYEAYIQDSFLGYELWIRDILLLPRLDREWSIWQYSNRGRVDGDKRLCRPKCGEIVSKI